VSNLLLVAACLGLGVALRRHPAFPDQTPRVLDALVLNLALPAMVLARRSGLRLDAAALLPVSMAWLQLGLVALAVSALGARLGWSRPVRAALMLTAGLSNTSFVGLPLVEAFLGSEALPAAILADQLGSFLAVSTAGLAIAAWGAGETASWGAVLGRLARFPALPALVVGALATDWPVPLFDAALERIGSLLTPLALLSVGFRLEPAAAEDLGPLVHGLLLKLVLSPAILLGLYLLLGAPPGTVLQATVLEAAMPPMITAAILATDRGLAPPLARAMVGVGLPVGVLTVWLWSGLLRAVAG
jgi:hypothetical protein